MTKSTKSVSCPTCKRAIEWTTDNKWRPFCSERCKLIDMGAWASGQHAIPGDDSSTLQDSPANQED